MGIEFLLVVLCCMRSEAAKMRINYLLACADGDLKLLFVAFD